MPIRSSSVHRRRTLPRSFQSVGAFFVGNPGRGQPFETVLIKMDDVETLPLRVSRSVVLPGAALLLFDSLKSAVSQGSSTWAEYIPGCITPSEGVPNSASQFIHTGVNRAKNGSRLHVAPFPRTTNSHGIWQNTMFQQLALCSLPLTMGSLRVYQRCHDS